MCFGGRRTPWNRCSGPKLGLHQCPCANQAYRTTFTVTKKGALLVVKKKTRAPKRAHVCVCVDGQCVPCCKDDVLSATERRHAVCTGRRHDLAFAGTKLYRLLLRGGSMFSLWVFLQALSIVKCSDVVVRHFALDVDPIWALCPCETWVVDPRCWCVD